MKRITASGLFFLTFTFATPSFGQEHTGVITDAETGDPLVGANATVQGTSIGASTGVDGRFSFQYTSNEDYTLVVSFVGYRVTERVLSPGDDTSNLNFSLETDVFGADEIVVTGVGSRGQPRSIIDSAVPIDVVKSERHRQARRHGFTRSSKQYRALVQRQYPAHQRRCSDRCPTGQPAGAGARSHAGTRQRQAPPPRLGDLLGRATVLPMERRGLIFPPSRPLPCEQVEVLRDGASAQYGSDAIAGVMNFQLKDSYRGGSIEFKPGIFQEGDGLTYAVAGNIGLGSENAWANLSLEYGNAGETDRSVQRNDAIALIAAGNNHM